MFIPLVALAGFFGLRETAYSALKDNEVIENNNPLQDLQSVGNLIKDSWGNSLTTAVRKAFSFSGKDENGNTISALETEAFLGEEEVNSRRNDRNGLDGRTADLGYKNLCKVAEYGLTAATGLCLLPFGVPIAVGGTVIAGIGTTLFGTPVGSSLKTGIAMKLRETASGENITALTNNALYTQVVAGLGKNSLAWNGEGPDPISFLKSATTKEINALINPAGANAGRAQAFLESLAGSARSFFGGDTPISGSLAGAAKGFKAIG